jgi:DMSO/TMAO reductase YedYZ molybdopterin-dependent catalytic subunit
LADALTRRDLLARAAAGTAWLAALGVPDALWAQQPGEEPVTFTDYTDDFRIWASEANPRVRCVDLRQLTTWTTPNDAHYTFNQTTRVDADAAAFRLHVSGAVSRPRAYTLAELQARPDRRDEAVTLECSGNSTRPQRMGGLLSNGVWTGIGLKAILEECGVTSEAREVVCLGLDMEREKKFQAGNREYEAPHGRAIFLQEALHPDTMLAFALNGQPLPAEQGFPLRLIVPGWYGMTQVKWLSRIHVLDRRYEGQHQVRNYLSLRNVKTPEGDLWLDTSISRNRLKSVVARCTRVKRGGGWRYTVSGVAWGGQVPIAGVDVQVDGGAWTPATLDSRRGKYAWVMWSLSADDLAPGTHTLVSRARDAQGALQPTSTERQAEIASGREDNSLWPREIRIE